MAEQRPTPVLTYPGDVTHVVGEVKGPSHLRELLTAVKATYDPATDATRVTFAYGTRCCECHALLGPDDLAVAVGGHDRFDARFRHPEGACAAS